MGGDFFPPQQISAIRARTIRTREYSPTRSQQHSPGHRLAISPRLQIAGVTAPALDTRANWAYIPNGHVSIGSIGTYDVMGRFIFRNAGEAWLSVQQLKGPPKTIPG